MIVNVENPKESIKELMEQLISEYSWAVGYKVIIKYQLLVYV